MLNSNNSVLIRTAVLLEFYLFCDAVAVEMDVPQLSHQAMGVFDNDDRVDKYIVVAKLLELQGHEKVDEILKTHKYSEIFVESAMNLYKSVASFIEDGV